MEGKILNTFVFSVAVILFSLSSVTSYQYQTLVVNTLPSSPILSWPEAESLTSESESTNSLSFRLSHIDDLSDASPAELFNLRLQQDSLRVESLISLATRNATSGISGAAISGSLKGSGAYLMKVGVGTPATNVYMELDTGSDIVWLQCLPCQTCSNKSDPIFNPAKSRTYATLSCGSPLCKKLDSSLSKCVSSRSKTCLYQVKYGDGSDTTGDLSTETLSFNGARVHHMPFGCGHKNQAGFFQSVGPAAILGLGRGDLSFPSQTKYRYNGKFSYCFVDRYGPGASSKRPSTIVFGDDAIPKNAVFTPLLKNPKMKTFYYVRLLGISVGGKRVPGVSESQFKIDPTTGSGGVFIDSGTTVTRLEKKAYIAFRDAFLLGTSKLKRAPGNIVFDTCYDLSGLTTVKIPTVVFHFDGGDVSLPANNIMVSASVDPKRPTCFAFAASVGLSIIGNIQQQGFRVAYDLVGSRVGFLSGAC